MTFVVVGIDPLQRVHVEAALPPIDERPDKAPLVEKVNSLRRRMNEFDVARVQIVGRQEFAEE